MPLWHAWVRQQRTKAPKEPRDHWSPVARRPHPQNRSRYCAGVACKRCAAVAQWYAPVVLSACPRPAMACPRSAMACPARTPGRRSRAAVCSGVAIGLAQACIVMSRSNSGARRPCNGMLRRCHRGCTVLQRHVPDRQRSAASPHYAPRTFRARGAPPRRSADARTPTDRARSSISRSSKVRRSFCSMLMERCAR